MPPGPTLSNAHYRQAGQRFKTGLLDLFEPSNGGSTNVPKAKVKVKPKVGRLALFDLVEPGTAEPDANSAHAGAPVWSGDHGCATSGFVSESLTGPALSTTGFVDKGHK
jgi:hypothetical protein